ncbi:MAG: class I SAM-dependent methyltransferase, partial [Treponema sp.]|nr:class I SAM-dependent methyltransferase [Treponema sp.]
MAEKSIDSNVQKIRLEYFAKYYPYDGELAGIVDIKQISEIKLKEDSHEFLKNPLVQNMHIYLIEYLLAFSKKWFRRNNFTVLDWGCGKCQVSYLLKKRNIDVTSCDIEKTDRGDSAFGQYTPIADFAKINVIPLKHEYVLPFPGDSFDIVLSFGVLEHVSNDKESLIEINRVLKPNGLFFCFWLPYRYSWRSKIIHMKGNNYHDHLYDKKNAKQLLEYSKMELIDIWYRDMLPFKSKVSKFRIIEAFDNWL